MLITKLKQSKNIAEMMRRMGRVIAIANQKGGGW